MPQVAQWIDREHPIPAELPCPVGMTGAQELARKQLDAITAWGYQITAERYVEETAANEQGRFTWTTGPRAIRFECRVDGRPVVVRYDSEARYEPWTVTVDDCPAELAPLWRLTAGERIRAIALAVHRAIRDRRPSPQREPESHT